MPKEWISEHCFPLFCLHMVSWRDRAIDKLERKGWFNTSTRHFLLFLSSWQFSSFVWLIEFRHNCHNRYSFSPADELSGCFRNSWASFSWCWFVHFSPGLTEEITYLKWSWIKQNKTKKTFYCQLPSCLIPHPPTTLFPSLRLLSSVRLLLPVET